MNVIFCGNSGTGKTSAIRRLLCQLQEPLWGFWTEKLAPREDGLSPVYFHGCREPLIYSRDHCIGICGDCMREKFPEVFDTLGVGALRQIPEGSLVLMDEIGIMEGEARDFIREIFRLLDGNYRVIAAVRDRSTPLLDAIRSHPKSFCISAIEARHTEWLPGALSALKPAPGADET